MRRILSIIVLLALCLSAYSQGFVPSDAYLYGVGMSHSEESADSVAMLSLSRSIYTKVTSESERIVSEVDGKYSDSFVKRTGLSSSIGITGAKKDVSVGADGQYVVYRYIDKEAYIADRIGRYSDNMNKGYDYEESNPMSKDSLKHRKNLALGSYYKAYEALVDTTGILNLLYGKEKVDFFKGKALERIENLYYNGWERIHVDNADHRKSSSGFRVVYPYSGQFITEYLYAFEYYDNGEWKRPVAYYEKGDSTYSRASKDDTIGETDYTRAIIAYTPKTNERGWFELIEYRWLFEEKVDGMYVKLNVPEWMYYLKENREIYINLN